MTHLDHEGYPYKGLEQLVVWSALGHRPKRVRNSACRFGRPSVWNRACRFG